MKQPSDSPKPRTLLPKSAEPSFAWTRTGRISRVKGRIWSRIGATVCSKKRALAFSAGVRAWACGMRPSRAGRAAVEKLSEAAKAAWAAGSAEGNSTRVLDRLLLVGEVAERRLGGGDEAFELASWRPSSVVSRLKSWITRASGDAALGDGAVEVGDVVGKGLEAAQGAGELVAATADALGAAGDEQLDVLARVGVEGAEEGVEVDVRFGLREGEAVAVLDVLLAGAGVDLDDHVVEVGFRPQQQGRVGVDQVDVLRLDVHADDGVAVFEVDRGDLADLDAGDVDRLALARGDGLGGGELARHVGEFFADEGDPGGQRGFLLGEDPERHHDATR